MLLSPEILAQTLALPHAERAALAHHLLLSLGSPDADEDVTDLESELEARLDAVESGNYTARDCSEAIADMRQDLKRK